MSAKLKKLSTSREDVFLLSETKTCGGKRNTTYSKLLKIFFTVKRQMPQTKCNYLSATEHFICDVLAGFHNSVTIQLQGNHRAFCGEIWESKPYNTTMVQQLRVYSYRHTTAKYRSPSSFSYIYTHTLVRKQEQLTREMGIITLTHIQILIHLISAVCTKWELGNGQSAVLIIQIMWVCSNG